MDFNGKESRLRQIFFSSISKKLTLFFIIVAIIAPILGILCFYTVSCSVIEESLSLERKTLLQTTAALIISLIAIDVGIIGFFVSRSISRPIKELYDAAKEVEKGNFDVRTSIHTNDEIEKLGIAFNNTAASLGSVAVERNELDRAKTEFLSITSHELRSPMTPMKAQLQMLEAGYFGRLNKKQKQSLAIIVRNTDRLDRIIVDFLEISRIEAARLKFVFQKTSLSETAREVVEFMSGFAKEKNIDLVLNAEKTPVIEADPDRMSQVLRNLINNAIKFSKDNSKVEIFVKPEGDHILFSVKDYGCGLTLENQVRAFEPFYQTEKSASRKYGGTGLGLAICRGIVESQRGRIWVESKLGEGCTFYFTVPLKPVREIEPIKVLFSPKDVIERKVGEQFKIMLGPLGADEFEEFKNKNIIWKEDLFKYVDSLTGLYILNKDQGAIFKNKIANIFGKEKDIINDKRDTFVDFEVV